MKLTRTVLATAVVAAAGVAVLGVGAVGVAAADGTAPAVPVAASALAAPTPAEPGITREAAIEAALAHVGGGQVESVEREVEHGVQVWDVDIQAGTVEHDVDVDATTGAILEVETDHDDD